MIALFQLCRMISYTVRIRLASQSLVCAWEKAPSGVRDENITADISNILLSVGCLKNNKNRRQQLYPQGQILEDQTYRSTHTFFTSLQEKVRYQKRPHKISQNALFAWHPACDRDQSRMPVEQFNKKSGM